MAFKATYNWAPFGRDDRVVMILSDWNCLDVMFFDQNQPTVT